MGITVPGIMTVDSECAIHGTAFNSRGDHVTWRAKADQNGWHVTVRMSTGREESGHGGTYNLALEVAARVRSAIGPAQ